jgi:hypothetical protein
MVDDEVDDAIWVVRKLLQGIVKFVIIRTRLRVECIKIMNLPFALIDKNTSTELTKKPKEFLGILSRQISGLLSRQSDRDYP